MIHAALVVVTLLGAQGSSSFQDALRVQVLLDRAHFSPGQIDGRIGSNAGAALEAYARERLGNATTFENAEAAALAALSAACFRPSRA